MCSVVFCVSHCQMCCGKENFAIGVDAVVTHCYVMPSGLRRHIVGLGDRNAVKPLVNHGSLQLADCLILLQSISI